MKKLLAIIIVLTVCFEAHSQESEDKGEIMREADEVYAEKSRLDTVSYISVLNESLQGFPCTNRPSYAADFYISYSDGDDCNDGLSDVTPWKTLDRLNATKTISGDKYFFKGGDEWHGYIIKTGLYNIAFEGYGIAGGKPVINGAIEISAWQYHDGDIYCADLPAEYTNYNVTQLIIDDERQTLARFPDEDFFTLDDGIGYYDIFWVTNVVIKYDIPITNIFLKTNAYATSVIDYDLTTPPNHWEGGRMMIRLHAWKEYSRNIMSSNLWDWTILPLDEEIKVPVKKPYNIPYYIENHFNALDSQGEWYYDETTHKIYVFWESGLSDLESRKTEASIYPYAFNFYYPRQIRVANFHIRNNAHNGIHARSEKKRGLQIVSNDIQNVCNNGVYSYRVYDYIVENCNIIKAGNIGIRCVDTIDNIIRNNKIESPGYTGIGTGHFSYYAATSTISRNTILSPGYHGISYSVKGTICEENFISNACSVFDDGGAIYTYIYYGNHSKVIKNIIIDTVGDGNTTRWQVIKPRGIYIDVGRAPYNWDVSIVSNTVINSVRDGISMRGCTSSFVHANTLYHNYNCQDYDNPTDDLQQCDLSPAEIGQITFTCNNIIGSYKNQVAVKVRTHPTNSFLLSNSNRYCNIHEDNSLYFEYGGLHSLTAWQNNYGQDLNSVDSGAMLRNACDNLCESRILYNPTFENKTFDLNGMEYFDIEANIVSDSVTLAPFTSKVLFFKADKHFVSHDGGHVSPFYYPEVAATNFQSAIDVAGTDHTVLVAEGTYLPDQQLNITTDIKVKSIGGAKTTIINGDDSHRCVRLNNSGAVLDGFTLTRGMPYYQYNGGGVYCTAGTVQNCIIKDNAAYNYGGGAYCDGQGTLFNCLVKDNDSFMGGGVYEADGFIINSTIINNYASCFAGGIYCGGYGSIVNSIIYNNSASCMGLNYYPSYPAAQTMFFYCCSLPTPLGVSCSMNDPQFADSDGRLSSDSPCVDAGYWQLAPLCDTDLDGFARVRGNVIDIGAYESAQTIDSTNVTGYMTAYISWTGPEYVDVWRNTTGTYTDYSPTNSDWAVEAANVTSPYAFPVYQYIYTHYNTPIYIHLTHTDIAHPMYEDDSVITIEPWDPAYFYYW